MRKFVLVAALIAFVASAYSQEATYDGKYNLNLFANNRNIKGVLHIKDSTENLFTGIMKIDNEEREVFGWYVTKSSNAYETLSMVFYVKIKKDYFHQQLFKGILSYDKTYLSGNYFYWGNEYPFFGIKAK